MASLVSSTMASLVAPSRSIFLSYIYATLFSLYLYHAQCVTRAHFALRRDVAGVAVDMADVVLLTTMVFIMTLIKVDNVTSLTNYNLSASRRVWDPGIWPNASRHHEPRTASRRVVVDASTMFNLLAVPTNPTTSFFHYSHPVLSHRHPLRPTRPTTTTSTNTPIISADRSGAVAYPFPLRPTRPINRSTPSGCLTWDPGIAGFAAPSRTVDRSRLLWDPGIWSTVCCVNDTSPADMFYYHHPVLSRPTVPNIQ